MDENTALLNLTITGSKLRLVTEALKKVGRVVSVKLSESAYIRISGGGTGYHSWRCGACD